MKWSSASYADLRRQVLAPVVCVAWALIICTVFLIVVLTTKPAASYDFLGQMGGGLVGGALGGFIGSQFGRPHYQPPQYQPEYAYPRYPGYDAVHYCMSRFRSYNPETGVYIGYDGVPRRCP